MRANTYSGGDNDRFRSTVHTPTDEFAYQRPNLHLRNERGDFIAFLTIDEVRNLIDVLSSHVEELQAADDQWATERDAVNGAFTALTNLPDGVQA